jgi:hypothetical protein
MVTYSREFAPQWDASVTAQSLLFIAGDRPKVDKDRYLGLFDFRSHQFSLEPGIHRRYEAKGSAFRASLMYKLQYQYLFSRKSNNPLPPKSFWQHGPSLRWGSLRPLRDRGRQRGFFPQLAVAYQSRESWEAVSLKNRFQFGPRRWWEGSAAIQWITPLTSRTALDLESSGQWISEGDRLNSRLGKNLTGDFQRRFFSELRADRFTQTDLGLVVTLEETSQIFLRPYGIFFAHRELTPFFRRNQMGGGLAVEVFGKSWQRMDWSFYLGSLYGLQKEPDVTHELGFQVSYDLP